MERKATCVTSTFVGEWQTFMHYTQQPHTHTHPERRTTAVQIVRYHGRYKHAIEAANSSSAQGTPRVHAHDPVSATPTQTSMTTWKDH